MLKKSAASLLVFVALAFSAPLFAADDPTLEQVYTAARTGHLDQAQQMMTQVLHDHPRSGKAHYIAAEIYAKQGNLPMARMELSTAESLEPGLPFAQPDSVRALQNELAGTRVARGVAPPGVWQAHRSGFPWGSVLILLGAIWLIWFIVRRRFAPNTYSQYPGVPVGNPGPPGYGPYPGGPMGSGGIGSGIAGGLASGLAVGAGVVAGEELAHRFLDGDRSGSGGVIPAAGAENVEPGQNGDMGGSDFGVSDPGSWDDGGIGGDVSGGDWT
jgi:hypothetical protein